LIIVLFSYYLIISNKNSIPTGRSSDLQGKTIQKVTPKKVGQPIKASTSKKVVKMMEGVIYDQKGLGHDYQIDGYKIAGKTGTARSEEHTSELQSRFDLVCRLLLEKKKR